ncbi:MAG: creatininase family protein [Proteobacteria bacterium]|nr:creatininase family protein [Pseudomonadota bacterium]
MRISPLLCLLSALAVSAAAPLPAPSPYLEELTWPEVAARMTTGSQTIIIPTGGTEQNGPHIALGKHNWIVTATAGEIARQLGNALVAPTLAYVPEGSITPPQGHMRFPGTISISDATFMALLEDAARSFKQHGFKFICLLGDSGGNQEPQAQLAAKLNKEWAADGVRVLQVSDYYDGQEAQAWAAREKLGGAEPEAHAGFMDAAEVMAAHPDGVRREAIEAYNPADSATTGVVGDPTGATAKHGEKLLAFKIAAAVKQIRAVQGAK